MQRDIDIAVYKESLLLWHLLLSFDSIPFDMRERAAWSEDVVRDVLCLVRGDSIVDDLQWLLRDLEYLRLESFSGEVTVDDVRGTARLQELRMPERRGRDDWTKARELQ